MIHGVTPIVTLLGATAVAPCPASHVHYGADPGVEPGLRSIPWIATSNGAFHAHLFYVEGTPWRISKPRQAYIFTSVVRRRIAPKVLWLSRRGARTGRLVIRGRRLDALGSFTWRQSYRSGYQFPSLVEIPAAGCWRVRVSSGGSSGSVVFEAVDTF